MVNSISNGSTNQNGKLTLNGNALTSGANTFVLKSGTNNISGDELASVTITPISLTNIRIISDDVVINGDRLPVTAKISSSASDLSGYTINFSGAITGNYTTDQYGQVTAYYTGKGEGNKSVTVTAGNWNATQTFTDYIEYWDTSKNYLEHYGFNQGFTKLSQYYQLDTSTNNMGMLCIGDNSYEIGDWELSFKVFNSLTNVYFDIFGWNGNPQSIYDINMDRQVSFTANDVIKATMQNGTLTVLKNNNSFFTKVLSENTFPAILIKKDNSSSNVSSVTSQDNISLNFNELKLKGA